MQNQPTGLEEPVQLSDGRHELKLQVDRRRLEAMITGNPSGEEPPSAAEFFDKVMSYSNAEIMWPTHLKIGAKTKKDPYVKLVGSLEQIEAARNLITASLQVKRERVTLKLELHHSLHSHIIGKGGRGVQHVMRLTACHIHFPDSNKYTEATKSDQVSISGLPAQIPAARRHLRGVSPVTLAVDLPWLLPGKPDVLQALPSSSVLVRALSAQLYTVSLRVNAGDDGHILCALRGVLDHFHSTDYLVTVRTSVAAREETLVNVDQPANRAKLSEMCQQYGVTAQFSNETYQILLNGPAPGVLQIRKFIIGCCPIILAFDVNAIDMHYSLSRVEKEYNVSISTKRKNALTDVVSVSMKTEEHKLTDLMRAREMLLAQPPIDYPSDEYTPINISNPSTSQLMQSAGISDPLFASLFESGLGNVPPPLESPKSPDPTNSPLAASILKGAKDISKNSEIWKKTRGDRNEMLAKATQAIFDDNSSKAPRYPTDLWAGYGFSCSLPADLLKGMIDLCDSNGSSDGRPLLGRDAKTPPLPSSRGLCALREEDELSDFSGSMSSNSFHAAPRFFDRQSRFPFSASTSVFDSSSLSADFNWDIRLFTDPSMVLSQLACSEYMTQLREQEIDMHAFLLLDEQNLKDIGVSTIGARKKIHHAIIKLRESAKQHGYAL